MLFINHDQVVVLALKLYHTRKDKYFKMIFEVLPCHKVPMNNTWRKTAVLRNHQSLRLEMKHSYLLEQVYSNTKLHTL